VAFIALCQALELDRLFGAARGFFEIDLEIVAKIVAAAGARAGAAASGSEEVAEDIGENLLEALAEIETAEAPGSAGRALERGVTEAVILRALFRIGEDLVGLIYELEIVFGFFVAGIAIASLR
jgi:hypothetical protein